MLDNDAQKNAPAFRLAALDHDFLLRDSMRGVRFVLEYAKAELLLRDWGIRSTIIVFGSARIRSPSGAKAPRPRPRRCRGRAPRGRSGRRGTTRPRALRPHRLGARRRDARRSTACATT